MIHYRASITNSYEKGEFRRDEDGRRWVYDGAKWREVCKLQICNKQSQYSGLCYRHGGIRKSHTKSNQNARATQLLNITDGGSASSQNSVGSVFPSNDGKFRVMHIYMYF